MKKHILIAVLGIAATLVAGCGKFKLCNIPVVNQIPGITCPSPAPSPGN